MMDSTLDALFEPASDLKMISQQPLSDGLKKANADTRARIQGVFSRQSKVAARLRRPTTA